MARGHYPDGNQEPIPARDQGNKEKNAEVEEAARKAAEAQAEADKIRQEQQEEGK